MKKLYLSLPLVLQVFYGLAQNFSGTTPRTIYSNDGNVGIGTSTLVKMWQMDNKC